MAQPNAKRARLGDAAFQVKSRYANMLGRFTQSCEYDGRPAYEKDDSSQGGPAWIFHAPLAGGKWVIGPSLPQGGAITSFVASQSDGLDPASVAWPHDKVDTVEKVDLEQERRKEEAEKAERAQMPDTISLDSPIVQITGEYKKVVAEGEWPSYQRRSGGDGRPCWLFRDARMPQGRRWFVGQNKPCGAQISFFFSSVNDGASPEKVQWPNDKVRSVRITSGSIALPRKPADSSTSSAGGNVEMLKIECKASNIDGIYIKASDFKGKPAFQKREKDCWLFYCPLSCGPRWLFGPSLPVGGGISNFFMSDQDAASPTTCTWPANQEVKISMLDPEQEAEKENAMKEAKANLPNKLAVSIENVANIPGGYIKRGSRDTFPVYERDSSFDGKKVFIFHESAFQGGPKWYFAASNPPPGQPVSIFFSSENDAPGPHMARWPIDKVEEVVDADHFKTQENLKGVGLFHDSQFPHNDASLGTKINLKKRAQNGAITKEVVQWIPARYLGHSDSNMDVFDGISPTDLLQGRVGDCWLVAAMSCLAEFPNRVKELFKKVDQNKGNYTIKLYDSKQSAWRDITIDEFIPSEAMHWWDTVGKPLFAKPNGNEMWALLLEKAMAKMMGNYSSLVGGNTAFAFRAMTGEENVAMWTKQGTCNQFGRVWQSSILAKGKDVFQMNSLSTQQRGGEQMFQELLKADKSSYLLGASMDVRQGHVRESIRPDGLVEGHAYAILRVEELQGQKLIKLRNPWGNDKEWKGNWCDNHPIWNQYPQVKQKLRPSFHKDGIFWMDWNDFAAVWDQVIICHKDVRSRGGEQLSRPKVLRRTLQIARVEDE